MAKAKRRSTPPVRLRGFLGAYMDAFAAAGNLRPPTLQEVADAAECSRSAACRALDQLADLGFLRRVEYDVARPGLYRYLPREP